MYYFYIMFMFIFQLLMYLLFYIVHAMPYSLTAISEVYLELYKRFCENS